jgi:outer membrane protein assembly factor BamE (lipoprotein component of BamABCDE complex)
MRKLMLVLAAAFIFCGCSSVGNEKISKEDHASIESKLVKGVTTKAEVRATFGDPLDATFHDSGNEMWKYVFTEQSCNASCYFIYTAWAYSSSSGIQKTLTVLFDDKGTVKNYILSESEVESKHGLFSG